VIKMTTKRKIEIFSAGCSVCEEAVDVVQRNACSSCEVSVLNMKDPNVVNRAKSLGIKAVPAVVIDGKLADCCANRGIDPESLKAAGLGTSLH
jgi:hypothetical protein